MRCGHCHPQLRDGEDPVSLVLRFIPGAIILIQIIPSLQLQGELQTKNEAVKKYKGVLHGVKVILQNEGPRGLFRGIGSAVSENLG